MRSLEELNTLLGFEFNYDNVYKNANKISLHGLGFLQVELPNNNRLHLWNPELPRRTCFQHSSIHDHRFGFTSTVLLGSLVNLVYNSKVVHSAPDATHMSYLHEGPRTQFGNRPWTPDTMRFITVRTMHRVLPGQSYDMLPYDYHSTMVDDIEGLAMTVMTKTVEYERGAHSLCDIRYQPDVDFDRFQLSDEALWEFVRDAVEEFFYTVEAPEEENSSELGFSLKVL